MKTRRTSMVAAVAVAQMVIACSGGETNNAAVTDPLTSTSTQAPPTSPEPVQTTPGSAPPSPPTPPPPGVTGQVPTPVPAIPTTPSTTPSTPTGETGGQGDVTSDPDAVASSDNIDSDTGPGGSTTGGEDTDVVDVGAHEDFSFFVTSYYHIALLSGSEKGFGGDLRYNGAATGLEGADAICQESARRVGFGHRTWKAYLSTSTVNAIDRIGAGPWFDFLGQKVADSPQDLIAGGNRQPGGCCAEGTYDEMGLFHDGRTDQNNDGIDDDDHDTMTATKQDGTYAGFSCDDWTSTTATSGGDTGGGGGGGGGGGFGGPGGGFGGLSGGLQMGHTWPAASGQHWATSHAGHQCAAGTNFIQDGSGDPATVGGGGGYGGFYCFALAE